MILTITLDKSDIQERIEIFFTELLRYVYGWLSTDGEVIGTIVGVYHVLLAVSVPILAFISHTIYPCIWLKLYVFCNLCAVFLQHVCFNICIMIPMEERLTNRKTMFYPVLERLLKPFNITVTEFVTYIVIAEGFTTLCFGLELLSHVSRFVYTYYGIDI